jgi:hypothetical protein
MKLLINASNGDVDVSVISHLDHFIVQVVDIDTAEFIEIKKFSTLSEARQHAFRFIV